MNVYGESGHTLTFKAYDHATGQELVDMNPAVTVTFSDDGSGTLLAPLELNFTDGSILTQTIELAAGANWVSFNVDVTLDDLKAALAATGNTDITIKGQRSNTRYIGGRWRGTCNLVPGKGFVYQSTSNKTLVFPSSSKSSRNNGISN